MSATRIAWEGEVGGTLRLPGDPARAVHSVEELADDVRRRGGDLDAGELDLLGGFALFLCIRDVRVGRAGLVLPLAEKRVGEACRGMLEGDRARAFEHGVATLREHLHPTRSEPHHVLAYLALLALQRRLEGGGTSS